MVKKYDCIYVSPHMDDVVFSASGSLYQNLKNYKSILIITVFTHNKTNLNSSCSDKPISINNNNINMLQNLYNKVSCLKVRRKEDTNAMEEIKVDFVYLDFPEILHRHMKMNILNMIIFPSKKYLLSQDIEFYEKYSKKIIKLVGEGLKDNGILYFPLGSGFHPDHLLIHDIGIILKSKYTVLFYEDIPYSFLYTNLKYRLVREPRNRNIWFDSEMNCNFIEKLSGISKNLIKPFCFLHLYLHNKLPKKFNYENQIIEFNENIFEKKIKLILMYKSQLRVCFGTNDEKKIKYLFKKYSKNIKSSKKNYHERYWKII